MLCRLALALACGLALATPSLADDGPPAVPVPILVTPPLQQARQADWKLVAGYGTWKPEQRNRIFYARTPGQVGAWKYHVYDTLRDTQGASPELQPLRAACDLSVELGTELHEPWACPCG